LSPSPRLGINTQVVEPWLNSRQANSTTRMGKDGTRSKTTLIANIARLTPRDCTIPGVLNQELRDALKEASARLDFLQKLGCTCASGAHVSLGLWWLRKSLVTIDHVPEVLDLGYIVIWYYIYSTVYNVYRLFIVFLTLGQT